MIIVIADNEIFMSTLLYVIWLTKNPRAVNGEDFICHEILIERDNRAGHDSAADFV